MKNNMIRLVNLYFRIIQKAFLFFDGSDIAKLYCSSSHHRGDPLPPPAKNLLSKASMSLNRLDFFGSLGGSAKRGVTPAPLSRLAIEPLCRRS